MITLELTKPLTENLVLTHLNRSVFEELHYGKLPLVWLRPNSGEDLGLAAGESGCYQFTMTPINLPAGMRRCADESWEQKPVDCSPSKPITTGPKESYVYFMIHDVTKIEGDCDSSNYQPLALDYCPPEDEQRQQDQHQDGDQPNNRTTGTDSPCMKVLSSSSVSSSSSTDPISPLICEYDYLNHVVKQGLKDKLKTKYFKRKGSGGTSGDEASKKPIKLIAALIPGKGIVWIPMRGSKPPKFDKFKSDKKESHVAYRPVFLDGPNIWIARMKDKSWEKPD